MSEDDIFTLLGSRLALSRLKRSQLSVKQQKILDIATRHAQYTGFQINSGALIQTTGGSATKNVITNGLILPGAGVRITGNTADQKPRPMIEDPPEKAKKLLQEIAIFYKIKKIITGEKPCTCGNWFFENGQCRQRCNDFSNEYTTKQKCLDNNPIITPFYFFSGWEYSHGSIVQEFNKVAFSFSGRAFISGSDGVGGSFVTASYQISKPRTFRLSLKANPPPTSVKISSAIGINKRPNVGYYGGLGYENFGFLPGTYDFISKSGSIQMEVTLPPGDYVFYAGYRFDTFNVEINVGDLPYSGSVEFNSLETVQTSVNVYYLRTGQTGSKSVKVLELREDDPISCSLTRLANEAKLYIKSGQKIAPGTNKLNWQKIEEFSVTGDKVDQKTFIHPKLPKAVNDNNWQAEFIDSSEIPDPTSTNKCFDKYKDNQANIINNQAFRCDLNQQVDGSMLKKALIQDAQRVKITSFRVQSDNETCSIGNELTKIISVQALDLPDKTEVKDVEIIAVSPIIK